MFVADLTTYCRGGFGSICCSSGQVSSSSCISKGDSSSGIGKGGGSIIGDIMASAAAVRSLDGTAYVALDASAAMVVAEWLAAAEARVVARGAMSVIGASAAATGVLVSSVVSSGHRAAEAALDAATATVVSEKAAVETAIVVSAVEAAGW